MPLKHYVTVFAFTVSSFVGLHGAAASTPIDAIPAADRVELHFRQDATVDYLRDVKAALAARGVAIEYSAVHYDARGRLAEIAFTVRPAGDAEEATHYHTAVTAEAGAYLYVGFAAPEPAA